MIVQHLLNHHFNIEKSNIHYTAAQMDKAFSVNECFRDFLEGDNNAENMAIQVVKSFDELGKNLRSLDDLPLVITSVLGMENIEKLCLIYLKSSIQFYVDLILFFQVDRPYFAIVNYFRLSQTQDYFQKTIKRHSMRLS